MNKPEFRKKYIEYIDEIVKDIKNVNVIYYDKKMTNTNEIPELTLSPILALNRYFPNLDKNDYTLYPDVSGLSLYDYYYDDGFYKNFTIIENYMEFEFIMSHRTVDGRTTYNNENFDPMLNSFIRIFWIGKKIKLEVLKNMIGKFNNQYNERIVKIINQHYDDIVYGKNPAYHDINNSRLQMMLLRVQELLIKLIVEWLIKNNHLTGWYIGTRRYRYAIELPYIIFDDKRNHIILSDMDKWMTRWNVNYKKLLSKESKYESSDLINRVNYVSELYHESLITYSSFPKVFLEQ